MGRWWSRRSTWARWAIGVVAALVVLFIIVSFFRGSEEAEDDYVPLSTVVAAARTGDIERIEVRRRTVQATTNTGDEMRARIARDTDVASAFSSAGVAIGGAEGVELEFERPSQFGGFLPLLINFLPLIVFLVVMYYVTRNAVREGMRRARADEEARDS